MLTHTLLIFIQFIFAGNLVVFSQPTPADFSFLQKLNNDELENWIKSKKRSELVIVLNQFIKQAENLTNQYDADSNKKISVALKIAEKLEDFFVFGKLNYLRGLLIIEKDSKKTSEAIEVFTKAIEYFKKTNAESAKILAAEALLEIASLQIKTDTGEFDAEAFSNIVIAHTLSKETNSEHLRGLTYKTLGLYFFYQGQYSKALAFFERSESILNAFKDYDSLLEVNTFSMHLYRNLLVRHAAIEISQKIDNSLKYSSSKRKKMMALSTKGEILNSNGDSNEAIKFYRKAHKIALELEDVNRAITYKYTIGKTLQWKGDIKNAEKELTQLIEIAERLSPKNEEIIRLSKIALASALESQGKIKEAETLFNEVKANLGDNSRTKLNYYWHYTAFLISNNELSLARVSLEQAKKEIVKSNFINIVSYLNSLELWLDYKTKAVSPEKTIEILNQSISQIKDEQLNSRSIGLNLNYLDEFIFPFHFKTLVQVEKGDFESALLDSDSYKSRWLISKMVSDKSFGIIDKSWIMSDEALELRNKIFQRLLISGLKGEDKSDVELQNLLKIHEEKLNQRQDVSFLTDKFKKTEISNIEFKELTANLSDKVILEYSFTNEFLTVFVIKQNQPVKAFKINVTERLLKERIEKWRGEIVGQDLGFKKESHELYDLLIKPIEAEIKSSSSLIIIPEGILWKLPFQALLNSQQEYLIQKSALSYVPSLKILQTIQKSKTTNLDGKNNVVGFGNPINESIKSLPKSEIEVKNLSLIYPSSTFFIKEFATETALKEALQTANTVHLAVHGKLDEVQPMKSSLILTKDANNDGNLEIEEIIGLKTSPQLVILSACSTNDGQVFNGEGLLSLTWAFLVAGSKNVVATQWEIDDTTTVDEMQTFHQQLSQNKGIAESLQSAALKQIGKKGIQNHPFYWAGFVSVGGF